MSGNIEKPGSSDQNDGNTGARASTDEKEALFKLVDFEKELLFKKKDCPILSLQYIASCSVPDSTMSEAMKTLSATINSVEKTLCSTVFGYNKLEFSKPDVPGPLAAFESQLKDIYHKIKDHYWKVVKYPQNLLLLKIMILINAHGVFDKNGKELGLRFEGKDDQFISWNEILNILLAGDKKTDIEEEHLIHFMQGFTQIQFLIGSCDSMKTHDILRKLSNILKKTPNKFKITAPPDSKNTVKHDSLGDKVKTSVSDWFCGPSTGKDLSVYTPQYTESPSTFMSNISMALLGNFGALLLQASSNPVYWKNVDRDLRFFCNLVPLPEGYAQNDHGHQGNISVKLLCSENKILCASLVGFVSELEGLQDQRITHGYDFILGNVRSMERYYNMENDSEPELLKPNIIATGYVHNAYRCAAGTYSCCFVVCIVVFAAILALVGSLALNHQLDGCLGGIARFNQSDTLLQMQKSLVRSDLWYAPPLHILGTSYSNETLWKEIPMYSFLEMKFSWQIESPNLPICGLIRANESSLIPNVTKPEDFTWNDHVKSVTREQRVIKEFFFYPNSNLGESFSYICFMFNFSNEYKLSTSIMLKSVYDECCSCKSRGNPYIAKICPYYVNYSIRSGILYSVCIPILFLFYFGGKAFLNCLLSLDFEKKNNPKASGQDDLKDNGAVYGDSEKEHISKPSLGSERDTDALIIKNNNVTNSQSKEKTKPNLVWELWKQDRKKLRFGLPFCIAIEGNMKLIVENITMIGKNDAIANSPTGWRIAFKYYQIFFLVIYYIFILGFGISFSFFRQILTTDSAHKVYLHIQGLENAKFPDYLNLMADLVSHTSLIVFLILCLSLFITMQKDILYYGNPMHKMSVIESEGSWRLFSSIFSFICALAAIVIHMTLYFVTTNAKDFRKENTSWTDIRFVMFHGLAEVTLSIFCGVSVFVYSNIVYRYFLELYQNVSFTAAQKKFLRTRYQWTIWLRGGVFVFLFLCTLVARIICLYWSDEGVSGWNHLMLHFFIVPIIYLFACLVPFLFVGVIRLVAKVCCNSDSKFNGENIFCSYVSVGIMCVLLFVIGFGVFMFFTFFPKSVVNW